MDLSAIQEQWTEIKEKLRYQYQLTDAAYNMWIRDLAPCDYKENDGKTIVAFAIPDSNPYTIAYYGKRFRRPLETIISETFGKDIKVDFTVRNEKENFADDWELKSLCMKSAVDRYDWIIPQEAGERLIREFSYVDKNPALRDTFLKIRGFITEFALEPWQYSFRGTVGNSLIAYVLGLTDLDPLEYGLDERFFYGVNGENTFSFEMNMAGANEIEKITPYFTIIPGIYNASLDCFSKATNISPDKIAPYDSEIAEYVRMYPTMTDFYGHGNDTEVRRTISKHFRLKNVRTLSELNALSWGSGVWEGNGEVLVREKGIDLRDLPRTADDIFQVLVLHRIPQDSAYEYARDVGMGKGFPAEVKKELLDHDIPEWYLDSANKVKHLAPKAQCLTYAEMQWKLAYYYWHFESRLNKKTIRGTD